MCVYEWAYVRVRREGRGEGERGGEESDLHALSWMAPDFDLDEPYDDNGAATRCNTLCSSMRDSGSWWAVMMTILLQHTLQHTHCVRRYMTHDSGVMTHTRWYRHSAWDGTATHTATRTVLIDSWLKTHDPWCTYFKFTSDAAPPPQLPRSGISFRLYVYRKEACSIGARCILTGWRPIYRKRSTILNKEEERRDAHLQRTHTYTYIHTTHMTSSRLLPSLYIYISTYIHTHVHAFMHAHTRTHTHKHTRAHTLTLTLTHTHTRTHTHTHTHTTTHTKHTHTHTHTHIRLVTAQIHV